MKSNNKNKVTPRKPDEVGGIYFSSAIKIFDPKTGEIILHKRGDG
jgi:hypothetical protein